MTGSLEGKTAIVAGAAGGTGRAIARRFAEAGARVMLADTDDAGLDETMAAIDAPPERIARFVHAIEDRLGVTNLIAATVDAFGRIDILVTRSRVAPPGGLFDISAADFDAALAGNARSVFLQSKLVAKRMVQQREANADAEGETGAIVNITSVAGQRTAPQLLAYSVACAALDQLTRAMAASLAPVGVRVNAVALGAVMNTGLREALNEEETLLGEIAQATPLARIGEAAEAAEAALFLASPAASFITGQIVAVDGGRMTLDPLAVPVR